MLSDSLWWIELGTAVSIISWIDNAIPIVNSPVYLGRISMFLGCLISLGRLILFKSSWFWFSGNTLIRMESIEWILIRIRHRLLLNWAQTLKGSIIYYFLIIWFHFAVWHIQLLEWQVLFEIVIGVPIINARIIELMLTQFSLVVLWNDGVTLLVLSRSWTSASSKSVGRLSHCGWKIKYNSTDALTQ